MFIKLTCSETEVMIKRNNFTKSRDSTFLNYDSSKELEFRWFLTKPNLITGISGIGRWKASYKKTTF